MRTETLERRKYFNSKETFCDIIMNYVIYTCNRTWIVLSQERFDPRDKIQDRL